MNSQFIFGVFILFLGFCQLGFIVIWPVMRSTLDVLICSATIAVGFMYLGIGIILRLSKISKSE